MTKKKTPSTKTPPPKERPKTVPPEVKPSTQSNPSKKK